jgi:ketosteroid isomerase-like protein
MSNQTVSSAYATDLEALHALNRDYINSVRTGDVGRFNEILATEFYCSNPDGTLIDREAFLAQTSRPVTIRNLQAHDVLIRIFADIAIIHARTTFTLPSGAQGAGRYTDVWARSNDSWRCVSAHVTRL